MMELFLLAGRQLRRKKLRVFLIVLGIAIGVAAVIGVTALGEGIRVQAVEQIKASHDLTTVEVSAGAEAGNVTLITESKIKAIKQEENVLFVAPYVKDSYVTQNNTYLAVKGVTPEYRGIHSNLQLEQGNWFDESTHSNYTQIVLGYDVAKRLAVTEDLGVGDEFGAKIRLYGEEGPPRDKSTVVKIVGILESAGDEHDNQVFVGITEAMEMDEKDAYDGLLVKVDDPAFVASVREKIEEIGLNAQSAQDVIDEVNRLMVAVTLVLGFFSGISLVVGALMVVNTMIISVYERTREIGLSKALGASDLDIMKMFLAECLIIGVMGGILGDLLGIGFSVMIDLVGKPFLVSTLGGELGASLQAGSITAITPSILAVGFAISLVLSIVSGLYPARRAARLSPLDALRQI
ncbi:MAG: ABC transporter permease [Methanosarcinales archaeon]|nr:ABC transporter permease [Methanosarcinales archaeon]